MIKYIIQETETLQAAKEKLNNLSPEEGLIVVNKSNEYVGTLFHKNEKFQLLINTNSEYKIQDLTYLDKGKIDYPYEKFYSQTELYAIGKNIPVCDSNGKVIAIIECEKVKCILPVGVLIMAGGRGERMKPLTEETPKPLLTVGGMSLLERLLLHLKQFGIIEITISVHYLAESIFKKIGDGSLLGIKVEYITESSPLGTMGSAAIMSKSKYSDLLVLNADLLTDVDLMSFYLYKINSKNTEFVIGMIPFKIELPYALLDTDKNNTILSLSEKPEMRFNCNAGIYLFSKSLLSLIPDNQYMDAPDFITKALNSGAEIKGFEIREYWRDIGRMEEFNAVNDPLQDNMPQ